MHDKKGLGAVRTFVATRQRAAEKRIAGCVTVHRARQEDRCFLHRSSVGEKLDNFPLAGSE